MTQQQHYPSFLALAEKRFIVETTPTKFLKIDKITFSQNALLLSIIKSECVPFTVSCVPVWCDPEITHISNEFHCWTQRLRVGEFRGRGRVVRIFYFEFTTHISSMN